MRQAGGTIDCSVMLRALGDGRRTSCVRLRDRPRAVLGAVLMLMAIVALAPEAHAGSRTYDVPGTFSYVVPGSVTSLTVTAAGGNGADSVNPCLARLGGKGRVVTQTLSVTPGEVLQVNVAGAGFRPGTFAPGGGGIGGGGNTFTCTGGGGGASDVRRGSFGAGDRAVVAGGGGGAGSGAAGGDAGSDGSNSGGTTPGNGGKAGVGGTGGAGGPSPDACCSGGTNGDATSGGNAGTGNSSGGGGGGGFGGGGGGSGGLNTGANGGGGGGGGGSLGTPAGFNTTPSGSGSVVLEHDATTMEVIKAVSPPSDPGRFDLKINGATAKIDAKGGDSTGQVLVSDAPAVTSVAETAGTATTLDDYDSGIACDSGQGGTGPGPLSVPVPAGESVICTITNTRKKTGTLTVVKSLSPASDPGRFDLRIDGVTRRAGAGDGDGTGPVTVNVGTRTVGESAVPPASAGEYSTAIRCVDDGGTVVATGSTAGPLDVPITEDDKIGCTITNTRKLTLVVAGDRCDPVSAPDVDVTLSRAATGVLTVSRQTNVAAVPRCPRPQGKPPTAPSFTDTLTRPLSLTRGGQVVSARSRRSRGRGRQAVVGPRRATFRMRLRAGRTRLRLPRIAGAQLTSGRYEFCVRATDTSGQSARDCHRFWLHDVAAESRRR